MMKLDFLNSRGNGRWYRQESRGFPRPVKVLMKSVPYTPSRGEFCEPRTRRAQRSEAFEGLGEPPDGVKKITAIVQWFMQWVCNLDVRKG